MSHVFAALLLTLVAEGPFRDLSFDAALAEARDDEKVVFVDFFTTWCGPCKRLDRTTWKDERVREWLGEHTVALKIDAEKQVNLARRYDVRAYPTLVFVQPDGTERGRIVGYVDAQRFLSQAEDALAGVTALDRARKELEGKEDDPMARGDFADALAEAGHHAEALEHYLWCFDEGEQHDPSYHGVKLSFLLGDIVQLSRSHPPALAALRERRAAREKRILDPADDLGAKRGFTLVAEYRALNENLGDRSRTLATLDRLLEAGQRETYRSQQLASSVTDLLLDAQRYADLYEIAGIGADAIEAEVARLAETRAMLEEHDAYDLMKAQLVAKGGRAYEVTLALDERDEAARIRAACLGLDGGERTYRKLAGHALAAGAEAPAIALAEEALEKTAGKDRERFERWWRRRDPRRD